MLHSNRTYRVTVRGVQWVVPRGSKHRVVCCAHGYFGHFCGEKTLNVLTTRYRFQNMTESMYLYKKHLQDVERLSISNC